MSTTFTLPQTVVKRLEKLSESSKRTPSSIIKQAVQDRIEYEEWKAKKIRDGLADIKAGRVCGEDEFWVQLEKARNERKKAA